MQNEEEFVEDFDDEEVEETEDADDEDDVYKDKDLESMESEGELSEDEEGFMQGYNSAAEEKKRKHADGEEE